MFAEDILNVLTRRKFGEFYGEVVFQDRCPFSLYLEGHPDAPTRDEILDTICKLFKTERDPRLVECDRRMKG